MEPNPAGLKLFDINADRLRLFVDLLEQDGEKLGLIGPREYGRIWSRHVFNSAALLQFVDNGEAVADVGTGAGFPGIVLALGRPSSKVHCIEPMDRRIEWLERVRSDLGIDNVEIHHSRAEDVIGKVEADVVTARAVAALSKLIPWIAPLARPGGRIALLKGQSVYDELDKATPIATRHRIHSLRVREVVPCAGEDPTKVVVGKISR